MISSSDIFGPSSPHTRTITSMQVNRQEEPFVVFYNPDNPNRVSLFISPELTPAEVTFDYRKFDMNKGVIKQAKAQASNTGSHQPYHLLAAVGLYEGYNAVNPELKKFGEFLKEYANGKIDLSKTTLKDEVEKRGIPIKPMNKEEILKNNPQNIENLGKDLTKNVQVAITKTLLEQHISSIIRGMSPHPLLKTAISAISQTSGRVRQ